MKTDPIVDMLIDELRAESKKERWDQIVMCIVGFSAILVPSFISFSSRPASIRMVVILLGFMFVGRWSELRRRRSFEDKVSDILQKLNENKSEKPNHAVHHNPPYAGTLARWS